MPIFPAANLQINELLPGREYVIIVLICFSFILQERVSSIENLRLENLKATVRMKPFVLAKPMLWTICASLFLFAFLTGSPAEIFQGMLNIIQHKAGLIADNFAVGGIAATFFNAGCIMAIALILFRLLKVNITGPGIACVLLCAGFSMFGKDIINIWPIIGGVFLYAKRQKDHFNKYIYNALYGTALAPIITEIVLIRKDWVSFLIAVLVGLLIGFVIPPLSTFCLRVHQGYSLYNVGFSAGLVGTLTVSIMRSFGYTPESQLKWIYESDIRVLAYLLFLFGALFILGLWLCDWKLKPWFQLFRHSGRLMSDFVLMDGLGPVLMNMASLGVISVAYLLAIGGTVNGATIGGIFTIVGFGAFGKHPKNVLPIIAGVVLGSLLHVWDINAPAVQLAALFGTCLAPIAGQYGWKYGILAGFLHSSLVQTIGVYHGGLNLYNNGFSAGIVALVLIPLIESIKGENINASR